MKLLEIVYTDYFLRGILQWENSSHVVLCLHGFERVSTTEAKFKALCQWLDEKNVSSFRLDFSGLGLSDGCFSSMTIDSLVDELDVVVSFLREKWFDRIDVVCHSLASCVVSSYCEKNRSMLWTIVFLAPAFDQVKLLRYWFQKSVYSKENISWENYGEFDFDENGFDLWCSETRETKSHLILWNYFQSVKRRDFSDMLLVDKSMLWIHGDQDSSVPLASVWVSFASSVVVVWGDHDMEKPSMLSQWLNKAIQFLSE